ncbi:hypothetical protein [Treponema sp. R80B11-R83G3]
MNKLTNISRPFKVLIKYILSYTCKDWNLKNYPIEYIKQKPVDVSKMNIKIYPWNARIINWYTMSGSGNTKEEAFLKLKNKFEKHKSENKKLLRPGKKMAIVFASSSKIDNYEVEAIEFFDKIFDLNYMEMFISDISSLYDFCWADESKLTAKEKIKKNYGINTDNIEGLLIVNILEQIRNSKRGSG